VGSYKSRYPSYRKDAFVLVGDAGYAAGPTGRGTSLALAGGYLLAAKISKHLSDFVAGLGGYEVKIRPLIKEIQKFPPLISTIMLPETAWRN
jgi:2-polyprenyl-6-methoxyphenol hydroxylase-like FAD-dependent oxidoreductase